MTTYLHNLITLVELINVLTWTSVEKQASEIDRTFPRLETTFVDARAKIRFVYLIDNAVVICGGVLKKLKPYVKELSAWYDSRFPQW